MNASSETDYMRLAMAIDCEGMIDIHTHRQRREHLNRTYTTYYVRIVITNTDPRLALWCRTKFGGNANPAKRRRKKWRPTLRWSISSRKAVDLLRRCMPYFLLKREQATLALAFQDTVTKRFGRSGHSKETIDIRVALQKQMKIAKRKEWPEFSTLVH